MPLHRVTQRLYFSDKKSAEDQQLLKNQKIGWVVSLAGKPKEHPGIVYKAFHFPDDPSFKIGTILQDIYSFATRILVHCMGGMSRSPSIIIGLLMILEGMSYQSAYARTKECKKSIQVHFEQQLKGLYDKGL